MHELTVQDKAADAIYALNDEDAGIIFSLINRFLENYDLPVLTPEEKAELDRLEAEDTEPGVPIEVLLEKYGVAV